MLRDYQQLALAQIAQDLTQPGNNLVVMPTGSGKSHIIAETANIAKTDVLILQPSQELLLQNREKLRAIVDTDLIGTYSASCGERTIKRYTFATIQSVYKVPEQFAHFGLVIIDEAHGVSVRKLESMYTSFFNRINEIRAL